MTEATMQTKERSEAIGRAQHALKALGEHPRSSKKELGHARDHLNACCSHAPATTCGTPWRTSKQCPNAATASRTEEHRQLVEPSEDPEDPRGARDTARGRGPCAGVDDADTRCCRDAAKMDDALAGQVDEIGRSGARRRDRRSPWPRGRGGPSGWGSITGAPQRAGLAGRRAAELRADQPLCRMGFLIRNRPDLPMSGHVPVSPTARRFGHPEGAGASVGLLENP
jgi:hypothetical protein